MTTLLKEILASLVRAGVGALLGWLIAKGWLKPESVKPEAVAELVTWILVALALVAAIVKKKIFDRKVDLHLAASPLPLTVAEAKVLVKSGATDVALNTPDHDIPVVTMKSRG